MLDRVADGSEGTTGVEPSAAGRESFAEVSLGMGVPSPGLTAVTQDRQLGRIPPTIPYG
jgi:hypothetical protein